VTLTVVVGTPTDSGVGHQKAGGGRKEGRQRQRPRGGAAAAEGVRFDQVRLTSQRHTLPWRSAARFTNLRYIPCAAGKS